jgi:hypothetical protein
MTGVFDGCVRIINIINMSSDGGEGPADYEDDDSFIERNRNSVMSARESYNKDSVT